MTVETDMERRSGNMEAWGRLEDKLDKVADKLNNVVVQQGQTGELLKAHVIQVQNALADMKNAQLEQKSDLKDQIKANQLDIKQDLKDHSDHPAPHETTLGRRVTKLEADRNKVWGALTFVGFLGTTGIVALLRGLGVGS